MFQKAIVEGDRKHLILGVAEPQTRMCQNQMVLAHVILVCLDIEALSRIDRYVDFSAIASCTRIQTEPS
jgi:hypothetical protein